jgi:hypothetical protein
MDTTKQLNDELLEQYIMAGSTGTGAEQLRVLSEHYCGRVRLRVAENQATPPDVLAKLASDVNPDVKIAVAANPSCDRSIVRLIAADIDVAVRHGLAQNIATPGSVLEELSRDENGWVRGEALKTLQILAGRRYDEVGRRRRLRRRKMQDKAG